MAYPSTIIFIAFCVVMVSIVFQSASDTNDPSSRCSTIKIKGYYCVALSLNSTLHYLYSPTNSTISVVFTAAPPTPTGWISWGINPKGEGMIGAGVIAAFKHDTVMTMRTLNLKNYTNIVYENLTFDVWDLKADESNGVMRIHATVKIPHNAKWVNHTWQVGRHVKNGKILKHESNTENKNAKARLTLKEAKGSRPQGDWSKKAHAVINTLAWGILNPFGLIAARHLKMFPWADPAWLLCIHICCHFAAYVVGFIGGLVGMNIGNLDVNFYIEIALICLSTFQIVAFFKRPKVDSNYYRVWKIFHNWIGYLIIAIGTFNVYNGFAVLKPEELWISIFTYVQLFLDISLVLLEGNYWRVYYKNQSNGSNREPGNEM